MTRRAVLYARVSSKDQEREGFSIPAQLDLLRSYAAARSIQVLQEFVDVETAKQSGRTSFGAMVTFARQHRGRLLLLVEKTDRLYRNLRDWVTIDELDLEIHLVKQGTVISPDSRSSDKFMHGIHGLLPNGTPEAVRLGTRRMFDILGPGSGYVLAAVHNIQPDVPPQNICALFDEGKMCTYQGAAN
jgi:hypothetical protein